MKYAPIVFLILSSFITAAAAQAGQVALINHTQFPITVEFSTEIGIKIPAPPVNLFPCKETPFQIPGEECQGQNVLMPAGATGMIFHKNGEDADGVVYTLEQDTYHVDMDANEHLQVFQGL